MDQVERQRREHRDWVQVWEMRMSEEVHAHARTERLKKGALVEAQRWYRRAEEARADVRGARESVAELKRAARAAEQETRRATFQNLALQRQLSFLNGDVIPRAQHVSECDRLNALLKAQEETIAELQA